MKRIRKGNEPLSFSHFLIFLFFIILPLSLGAFPFLEELLVGLFLHHGANPLLEVFEDDEEERYGEEDGQCAHRHSTYHTNTNGAVTVG